MTATVGFSEFIVELEDLDSPGTYVRPCGITSRSFKRTVNTSESTVPDCDDETLPAELQRGVVSEDWSIDGSFTVDKDDLSDWEARIGTTTNLRVSRPKGADDGIGALVGYTGPGIITNFEMTGEFGSRAITGSVTITGAGKLTRANYVPAP